MYVEVMRDTVCKSDGTSERNECFYVNSAGNKLHF